MTKKELQVIVDTFICLSPELKHIQVDDKIYKRTDFETNCEFGLVDNKQTLIIKTDGTI